MLHGFGALHPACYGHLHHLRVWMPHPFLTARNCAPAAAHCLP